MSFPTPCLKCVHASVHVFVLTWLHMLAKPPMDSYMETWVPICDTVCVSQSPFLCSQTLIKMCTCISACIHVHLTYNVCFIPLNSYMEIWVPLCGSVDVSQWPHFYSHTLVRMCTCISTCIHVHLTPHVCATHQSQVGAPIGGGSSYWKWELQMITDNFIDLI